MALPPSIQERYDAYLPADLTWRAEQSSKPALVSWVDHVVKDLGPDPSGRRFAEVARRMLSGHYYPPDAINFFGLWTEEGREIRAGDRILQRARLLPFLPWPVAWAMTEVFVAERSEGTCKLGYLTTRRHFGRGIWQAELVRKESHLTLIVASNSGPQSWLFWVALPWARFLQRRAWRRAFEEFAKVG